MSRSAWALVFVTAEVLLSTSCKLGQKGEQEDRALPSPEPSAATEPAKPAELDPAPSPRPQGPSRAPAASPAGNDTRPAATSVPQTQPTTSDGDAPAATATATTAAPTAPSAPPPLNANCLPKCQTSLQACISKPVALDGGLPSLESMAECRKAFDDCRAACGT